MAVASTSMVRYINPDLASAQQSLPYIIGNVLPAGFAGLGFGVLFAAAATTLAGVWSAMSTMIVGDFLQRSVENNGGIKRSVAITLALAFVSYVLSNTFVDSVFDKLILANIPIFALSFALFAGFYWRHASSLGAYVSIATGIGWGVFTFLKFGEEGGYTWYWAIYGLPLIFITGILGSLLAPEFRAAPANRREAL